MRKDRNWLFGLSKIGLAMLLLVFFASCRDQMNGLNKNLKEVTKEDLKIDGKAGSVALPDIQLNIKATTPGGYQLQQNLGPDMYGGYLMTGTPFLGNINVETYHVVDGWVDQVWDVPTVTLNAWLGMKKKGYDKEYPGLYGIALVCKVFAAQRAADAFGPIPYTEYGTSASPKFDSVKEAYYAFFKDLKQAVQLLTTAGEENLDTFEHRFKPVDKTTYGGDYAKWIKVANTLRLRYAIRISNVDPTKAQQEAEAAVNNKYGVIESSDGSFKVHPVGANPIYTIANSWGDTRMASPIVTILKGYQDPRLAKYALPVDHVQDPSLSEGEIKGIRPGISLTAKSEYNAFSKPNIQKTDNVLLIDVAESYFLRAEGALRGWNMGGTAEQFYKDGVIASFEEHGLSAGEANQYLSDDTHMPAPLKDPKNPSNNVPAVNLVTVKWDPGASFQVKLQKIITQKWIAMFPDGDEAWAEFRRTGYPKMWPVVVNNSTAVPDGEFITRYPYTTTFTNTSSDQVDEAVNKYLNGQDNEYQRLWWDTSY